MGLLKTPFSRQKIMRTDSPTSVFLDEFPQVPKDLPNDDEHIINYFDNSMKNIMRFTFKYKGNFKTFQIDNLPQKFREEIGNFIRRKKPDTTFHNEILKGIYLEIANLKKIDEAISEEKITRLERRINDLPNSSLKVWLPSLRI